MFNSNSGNNVEVVFKFKKVIKTILFGSSVIYMFSIAINPATHLLCVVVFQIICLSYTKISPPWLSSILVLISNDVERNPGPEYHSNFFNFMSWNLNSLPKNDFARIQLIEAHNTIFNYDLISICETSLNNCLVPKVPELKGYTFEPVNHASNMAHGGVGLFYKKFPSCCS